MDNTLVYNKPWILQRADPYVFFKDGYYYFTASVPAYDGIILRRSKTLNGLAEAEEKEVWHKHESGLMSEHVWAPEIHYLFGKWYIYFAAGEKEKRAAGAVCAGLLRACVSDLWHAAKDDDRRAGACAGRGIFGAKRNLFR